MTDTKTLARIENIAPSYAFGARDERKFVEVRRSADGALSVECGWVVPETDEDDPGASARHPFKSSRPRAWVGRAYAVASAAEAAELLEQCKAHLWTGGGLPANGVPAGSVRRG